jgi:hypothetical protein
MYHIKIYVSELFLRLYHVAQHIYVCMVIFIILYKELQSNRHQSNLCTYIYIYIYIHIYISIIYLHVHIICIYTHIYIYTFMPRWSFFFFPTSKTTTVITLVRVTHVSGLIRHPCFYMGWD